MKIFRKNITSVLCVMLVVLTAVLLTGCRQKTPQERISAAIDIDCSDGEVIVYECHSGGLPINKSEYGELVFFSDKLEREILQSPHWNEMPLSENLSAIIYGNEEYGSWYEDYSDPLSAPKLRIPEIKHGYYYFLDKISAREGEEQWNDSLLLSRGSSVDYVFAIYDTDTQRLYYGLDSN